jgi:Protein kinase domain/Lysozyme inhibitor LprI
MDALVESDGIQARLTAVLGSKYVLGRELQGGSMSRVFSAWDVELARTMVIKVLPPLSNEDATARFRREIRLAAGLQHPHIVPLFDAGEADGLLYYTMPFIEGESLRTRLARDRRLDAAFVSRVLGELAGALAYAHRHGLVHRDVKPENVFLEFGTGRALLADFGVARTITVDTAVTASGVVIGTPMYMSPEQFDGQAIDGRSDLYSLGLVGWEMLTGERPWAGQTLYSIIYNQKFEALPSLAALPVPPPTPLRRAIERALAKRPAARWSSGDAFALAARTGQRRGLRRRVRDQQRWLAAKARSSKAWATGGDVADQARRLAAQVTTKVWLADVRPFARRRPPEVRPAWLVVGAAVVLLALRGVLAMQSPQAARPDFSARTSVAVVAPVASVATDAPTDVSTVANTGDNAYAADQALAVVYERVESAFPEPAARRELARAEQAWQADRARACRRRTSAGAEARCEGELSRRRMIELTELLTRLRGDEPAP